MKSSVAVFTAVAALLTLGLCAKQISAAMASTSASLDLSPLHWRHMTTGFVATRVNEVAVPRLVENGSVHSGRITYAASPGGLYKTTDYGATWISIFNNKPTIAISAVAVAPSNANIVWAGTGDFLTGYGREVPGDGIYKSVDGGSHWTSAGLRHTILISRIVIDPTNPSIVYAAALGSVWRPSPDRGIYKTANAGATWTRVAFVDDRTGGTDLAMDPKNSNVLYAAMWQDAERFPAAVDHGPGSRLLRSTDGGATWTRLTGGLPTGDGIGRIAVAISATHPERIYAFVPQYDLVIKQKVPHWLSQPVPLRGNGVLFRSDDGGDHWSAGATSPLYSTDAAYRGRIYVDPSTPDTVYRVSGDVLRSTDGGKTLKDNGLHLDDHSLWIDPDDSAHLIGSGDVGVAFTRDRGRTWQKLEAPFGGGLYFSVAAGWDKPFYHVFGTLQDYGVWQFASRNRARSGVGPNDWHWTNGTEDSGIATDRFHDRYLYAGADLGKFSSGLAISRYDRVTNQMAEIDAPSQLLALGYDVNWEPIIVSGARKGTLYLGDYRVQRSVDGGSSWTDLTGDLTATNPRFKLMGVTLSQNHIKIWRTVNTIAESPLSPRVIWFGTNYGFASLSRDGGRTWRRIRVPVGRGGSILGRVKILASTEGEGTAYIALHHGYFDGDFSPYLYKTIDYGAHWRKLVSGLPLQAAITSIVQHPKHGALLFVGTELGVYYSTDAGAHWRSLRNNMPSVRVMDLALQPEQNDLIAGTWGSGAYILDDIGPLQFARDAEQSSQPYLFPIRDTVQYLEDRGNDQSYCCEQRAVVSENPPFGVPISYFVPHPLNSRHGTLEIHDSSGAVGVLSVPAGAGLHRAVWDLSDRRVSLVRGRAIPAVPGMYRARLKLGGTVTPWQAFRVIPDPVLNEMQATYRAHHAFLVHVARLQVLANGMLRLANSLQRSSTLTAARRTDLAAIKGAILSSPLHRGSLTLEDVIRSSQTGLLLQLESIGDNFSGSTVAPTEAELATLGSIQNRLFALRCRMARLSHKPCPKS